MDTKIEIIDQKLPTVVIVGRVNVGKSTLFNKMTETGKALISNIPGTTRTKNIGTVNWRGKNFRLIDTGGLTFSDDVPLEDEIIQQTLDSLKEAGVILFLIDVKTGIMPQEKELAKKIIKRRKDIILVGNKADSKKWMDLSNDKEFFSLGLGQPFPVSAANGANVGDLLDIITKKLNKLPQRPKKLKEYSPIKVALIGKPNVGKSTLFNSLIGKEEVITSDMAHTTREPFDILVKYDKQPIQFVDTAGIRRKAKVRKNLEGEGVRKSISSIEKSDVVLLLLDASDSISSQDKQLGGLLKEHSRSVIIIINKWDTADQNDDTFRNQVKKMIYSAFPHLSFAPIIMVSAKTKYRVHQIMPEVLKAWEGRNTVVSNPTLDRYMEKIARQHLPARGKGVRHPKILGLKQLHTNPPILELVVKAKTSLHSSYLHFVKNKLREKFNFYATPIVIKLKKQKK